MWCIEAYLCVQSINFKSNQSRKPAPVERNGLDGLRYLSGQDMPELGHFYQSTIEEYRNNINFILIYTIRNSNYEQVWKNMGMWEYMGMEQSDMGNIVKKFW